MLTARTYGRAGCCEQPRRSKMAWLKVWRALLRIPGVKEVFLAACQYGSIHKKEFRLFGVNLRLERLARPCRGGHTHVVIQGKYTKASAVYPDELAREIAIVYGEFLNAKLLRRATGAGLESPLINDLLAARPWTLERVWKWKRPAHINLLEFRGLLALLKQKTADLADTRLLHLFDSSVSLAAATKGRSSSRSLAPLLGQSCTLQLAAGIYCAEAFAPTRLNIADDPTRDAALREPQGRLLSKAVPEGVLAELAQVRVKRFLANWLRLACLLAFLPPCKAAAEGEGDAPSTLSPVLLFPYLRSGLAHLFCFFDCHLCRLSDAAASWMFIPSSALLGFCALLCLPS